MVVPPVAVPAAVAVDPRHDDRCISPIGFEFGLLLDLLTEFCCTTADFMDSPGKIP